MDNSTLNITAPKASTNFTIGSMTLIDSLKIVLCSINVLFGVPTNSYVIWLIVTGTKSSITSRFFNLNLSVCEIGNCLSSLLVILSLFSSHHHMFTPVSNFFQGLGITGRPVFQCVICVERYIAVVHPVTFLKYKSLRYRVMFSTSAWITCLASCFCCIFIFVSFDLCLFTLFFLVQFLVFLSIQLFCLTAVLRALKQPGPGERGKGREEENHMKRRAFHLILITTMNMVILYVPFIVFGFVFIFTNLNTFGLWFSPLFCYIVAGFIQPVLFLKRAGKLSCLCSA